MSPPSYPSPPPIDIERHGVPPPSGVNGFAIASLLLGFVAPCGGGLLSVIFGIVALIQVNDSRQRGKGLAIGGLVATGGWLAVIAIAVVIGLANGAARDGSGEIADGGPITVGALAPGDCVNDLTEEQRLVSLPAVPCTEPHEGEVYALFDVPMDGAWPGDEALIAAAGNGCVDRLAGYSRAASDDDLVDIYYVHPTRGSWRTGDREIICIAYFLDGRRTGSLAD